MKKSPLQKIEDFYKNQGYRGDKLRRALLKDKEWIKLYKKRQQMFSPDKSRAKEICNVNK